MNTLFNLLSNGNKISKSDYDKNYQSLWNGRLRTTKQYQAKTIAPLTKKDDLSVSDLEWLENNQVNFCLCCGTQLARKEMQICHAKHDGHLTLKNIWLGCRACNMMQKDVHINMLVNFNETGMYFLDYFEYNESQAIKKFKLDSSDVKRIYNRINRGR